MCQPSRSIAKYVREYKSEQPNEFVPHVGTVFDMGGTYTHKRSAIMLFFEGHLTSKIANKIDHAPKDVDKYKEGKNINQISFLVDLRPRTVKEHIGLYEELKKLKRLN
jgi:hypothetical protein